MQGGWDAVNAAFATPPASTEQILHPDKYLARKAPVAVTLSDTVATKLGAGWSLDSRTLLGEFQLQRWLADAGGTPAPAARTAAATAAAAGWGGDRVALYDGPANAWGVVMHTAWDSEADATQFLDAADTAVETLGSAGTVVRGADPLQVWVVLGSDAATATKLQAAAGLPN